MTSQAIRDRSRSRPTRSMRWARAAAESRAAQSLPTGSRNPAAPRPQRFVANDDCERSPDADRPRRCQGAVVHAPRRRSRPQPADGWRDRSKLDVRNRPRVSRCRGLFLIERGAISREALRSLRSWRVYPLSVGSGCRVGVRAPIDVTPARHLDPVGEGHPLRPNTPVSGSPVRNRHAVMVDDDGTICHRQN